MIRLSYVTGTLVKRIVRRFHIAEDLAISFVLQHNGRCAICKMKFGSRLPSIDHCHKTKRLRGLLCMKCNSGLGYFADSTRRLEAAARYLRVSRRTMNGLDSATRRE